jgi:hypothetical protein
LSCSESIKSGEQINAVELDTSGAGGLQRALDLGHGVARLGLQVAGVHHPAVRVRVDLPADEDERAAAQPLAVVDGKSEPPMAVWCDFLPR